MKIPMSPVAQTVVLAMTLLFRPPTCAGSTEPRVMNFDNAPDRELERVEDYVEDGIRLSVVRNHYDLGGGRVNIDTDQGGFPVSYCTIRFELEDGGPFYLNSLHVGFESFTNEAPITFPDYVFEFSDGSTFSPEPAYEGEWIFLQDEFSGLPPLDYFTYTISHPTLSAQMNTQLDNITMTPVPEPAAVALLALGLLALFAERGKRRLTQTHQGSCPCQEFHRMAVPAADGKSKTPGIAAIGELIP